MATGDIPEAARSVAILALFPRQGEWGDGDYFALPGNHLVELVRGHVEVLPVPTMLHQFLARLIFLQLHQFVEQNDLGLVMTAPTKVRIDDRHYREPDVLFVAEVNRHRYQQHFWETIDLAVEVVSPDDPDRDLIDKKRDYAAAGIPEYWIVDPRDDSIQVLELKGGEYAPINDPTRPLVATSRVLLGFEVEIPVLFAEARKK